MTKKKSDTQPQPADIQAEQDQQNQGDKIGLKPGPEKENDAKKEARWQKVSAIFEEAHKAYTDGSGFGEVISSLIETLMNLGKSEMPRGLGGLGINDGPEMNLPPEDLSAQQPPVEETGQEQ